MLKIPKLRIKTYEDILKKYVKLILKDAKVVGLILHGSLARGLEKPYPESDIDLIVVAEGIPKDIFERKLMASKIKQGEALIEDLWVTPEELIEGVKGGWGVILDALADGVVMYDRIGVIAEAKKIVKSSFKRVGRVWVLGRARDSSD